MHIQTISEEEGLDVLGMLRGRYEGASFLLGERSGNGHCGDLSTVYYTGGRRMDQVLSLFQFKTMLTVCRLNARQGRSLIFMQDGASGHAAQSTKDDLSERNITVVNWPPYSPDLNPIETLWCKIKDIIQLQFPHLEEVPYEQLRQAIIVAWESIGQEDLQALVQSMRARCEAVIAANGMYTKY